MGSLEDGYHCASAAVRDDSDPVYGIMVADGTWRVPAERSARLDGILNDGGHDAASLHAIKCVTGVQAIADCRRRVQRPLQVRQLRAATTMEARRGLGCTASECATSSGFGGGYRCRRRTDSRGGRTSAKEPGVTRSCGAIHGPDCYCGHAGPAAAF